MNYLILDANDITNVCGVISSKELLKEINKNQLRCILEYPNKYKFRENYILVEESFDNKNTVVSGFAEVKINESKTCIYYVNRNGNIYSLDKKTKIKTELTKFINRNCVYVKAGKDYRVKNIVAQMFIPGTEKYDVVLHKNGDIFDCSVDNLEVIKHSEYAKNTGALARSQPVGLYKNNKLVQTWSSARKCAKSLFCSYQCVMDVCNGKTKNPMFDVRWI